VTTGFFCKTQEMHGRRREEDDRPAIGRGSNCAKKALPRLRNYPISSSFGCERRVTQDDHTPTDHIPPSHDGVE
jgi:hypothetical protein